MKTNPFFYLDLNVIKRVIESRTLTIRNKCPNMGKIGIGDISTPDGISPTI